MLILSRRKGESLFIGEIKLTVRSVSPIISLEHEGQACALRVNQHLNIRPDISVFICGRQGAQVRIGIHAPADVVILREELRK